MKEMHSNINIIGGGLIGTIIAYSLSEFGFKIILLEKNRKHRLDKNEIDTRTVAISEGTKNFLTKIGIWSQIDSFAEPIQKIKVIDRELFNSLEFDNKRRVSNLGYIVKNKLLLNILYKNLNKIKNIKILNNINIKSIENQSNKSITILNDAKIVSDLTIAADGKNSFVRKILKTPYYVKDYNKKALVTIFTHSKNHNGTAFEFFYKNGPLAILPMRKINGAFASSMVWTNESKYLDELVKMDPTKFISVLNEKTQSCIGSIKALKSRQLFPLSAHLNSRFYENRLIYVGDSAHSFHPIAGQGWNLGVNDVKNLHGLVKNYYSLGLDLGDKVFCKKYHEENYYNAFRLYQITDKLDYIFKIQNPIFNYGRSVGVGFLQKNKAIKDLISDFAMGLN